MLGKFVLAMMIVLTVAASLAIAALTLATRGPAYFVVPAIRLVLTVVLLACVFVGFEWARWVSVVLFGLAACFGVLGADATLLQQEPNLFGFLLLGGLTTLYAMLVGALLIPNPVTDYLRSTRE